MSEHRFANTETTAETFADAIQRSACEELTELLRREHPEWQANITYRFGQVVIESAPEHAATVKTWLESAQTKRYATGNQQHLYGASHASNLPKDVRAKGAAQDIGDDVRVVNAKSRSVIELDLERMTVDEDAVAPRRG